jgi:7SK snRNA methylphosphate capping enzyme
MKSEYFANKTILDIGCNDGTVVLQIALRFLPKLIRGIDIDYTLINKAIENMNELEKAHKKIKTKEHECFSGEELKEEPA